MPQPWEQYAAKSTPPPSGDGPWNNYGGSNPTVPEDPGILKNVQNDFDTRMATDPKDPLMLTGLKSVIGAVGTPLVHPWETIKNVAKMASDASPPGALANEIAGRKGIPQEIGEGIGRDIHEGGLPYAGTKLAGNIFGGLALGAPVDAAVPLARALGGAAERGGLGVINHAIDATPKMMKYGQNPARGLVDEGIAPSLSKFSLANKVDAVLPQAGARVSDAVHASPNSVPLTDIARSIESPVAEARGIIEGPGGGNRSFAPVEALQDSMTARAPGASRPIYGPGAGTPFQPAEVANAMGRKGPFLLNAPEVDTPLHSSHDIAGTPTRNVTLHDPTRMGRLGLPAPVVETPLTDNPFVNEGVRDAPINLSRVGEPMTTPEGNPNYGYSDQFPSGEGQWTGGVLRRAFDGGEAEGMPIGAYHGQVPGERGGLGNPQGVLRARPTFPASSEPSPFMDMRHPVASAPDVWQTIRNLDRNTRFNPDPEVEGVNEVRRDMRGGLRGNLETAVPGLKPLSQRYGDLATADEALSRTAGKGSSLGDLRKAFSFPLETTVGTGMVKGGRLLAKTPNASPFFYSAPAFGRSKESQ